MNKKKHHFISNFILKNFSKNGKIFIYRHSSKKIFPTSIKDAFVKNDLNTLNDNNGGKERNIIEDIFDQYFESDAAESISKIIQDISKTIPDGNNFSATDYLNVLRFCMLSNFRIPYLIERNHHASQVNIIAAIMMHWYLIHSNFEVPFDNIHIPKPYFYGYLKDFDKATKLLVDLKLTIYTHKFENEFFIIPDNYVIDISPNACKFHDKYLKLFFPISSKIVLCFERIDRSFSKGLCYLSREQINEFNRFFAQNTFESFGCESGTYLEKFVNDNELIPLKRFIPDTDFIKEKKQIQEEIILKLPYFEANDEIISTIDKNNEFRLLTNAEFEILQKDMNPIRKRVLHEIKVG